ncbi:hypothetical protein ACNVED_10640 [Legionella sp. D16C41]|uniref:hypothetical protein n=1 Tax=Legionella sp. D16C41 TaxID=3402688 RepID=UPI003AF8922E
MSKLNLSKLISYAESQKNANKTKFNLSNKLLNFLQEQDWSISILKASLLKAYHENSFIEEKAEQLTLQEKRYWSLGKLWHSSIDKNFSFTIDTINAFISDANYKNLLADGIPSSLLKKSWYQSQTLHNIIYDLYQQALDYEEKLKVENDIFTSWTLSHTN